MPAIVAAGIQAAGQASSSIINNTFNTLMKNKIYKAQADAIKMQAKLAQLSTQQQYELKQELQQAQTADEQMKILTDAISQINVASVQGTSGMLQSLVNVQGKNTMTTAIILLGSVGILVIAYYFIYKKD
jgi:hypothetical protein